MARSGTQEQPTVEEMLVSIRQAIHGENAKKRTPATASSAPPTPPAVSGSMRQMRVSMASSSHKKQSSVRTHSDNFQKLKKQLHDLDPLLGKQGQAEAKVYRAQTANGFAGILNGDVKLEEALAKLERAGLGDAQPEHAPEFKQEYKPEYKQETAPVLEQEDRDHRPDRISHHEPAATAAIAPRYETDQPLRGVEQFDDDFDEYEFDDNQYDETEIRQSLSDRDHDDLSETYYDNDPHQYKDNAPSYIQRSQELQTPPAAPVAPPVARAPLAPPPAPRPPSYGYKDEPINTPLNAPDTYQTRSEPVAPIQRATPQYADEPPMMRQPVVAQQPASAPMVAVTNAGSQSVSQPETGLTSPHSAQEASDMFASLAQTIMHQASTGNRSIDDITKELLHPMLRGWLDENLPRMVERLIREEIERVARGGAR